jgi:hypothetical protein
MAHLGDFGTEKPAEPDDTFGYFGATLRLNPELVDADLLDFLEAGQALDETDPKAAVMVKDFLRNCVHPEDFDQFWATGKKHRQSIEDRMKLADKLISSAADRPTGQPSVSSPGLDTTAPKSEDDFSWRVQRRLEAEGRPDLAVAVVRKREAEQARLAGTG